MGEATLSQQLHLCRASRLLRRIFAHARHAGPASPTLRGAVPGSETTTEATFVFDAPDIVTGLADLGYHTVCIGGVGFFNKASPLGRVLPGLFRESHWRPELGVTDPHSTEHQIELACTLLERLQPDRRLFLFINISALHQPNNFYLPGSVQDSLASHGAALAYVDSQLPRL